MKPEQKVLLSRFIKGLGWVIVFLLIVGLGALTGCLGGGFLGDLLGQRSGKHYEQAMGYAIVAASVGALLGGTVAGFFFVKSVRKRKRPTNHDHSED